MTQEVENRIQAQRLKYKAAVLSGYRKEIKF